jgi:hypothetical protein
MLALTCKDAKEEAIKMKTIFSVLVKQIKELAVLKYLDAP